MEHDYKYEKLIAKIEHDCKYEKLIAKIEHDLYHGNGKPGITTRLAEAEGRMDRMEKEQVNASFKQNWMITLLITTLIAVIVNLVRR